MGFNKLSEADAKKAIGILIKSYPDAKYYLDFKTPVDLLVAAILSAQTRDEVVNAVTPELFKRYRTAKDYADADKEGLIRHISSISFAGNKAANIIKTCKIIDEKHNGNVPRKMQELLELPGIGRKTANTILINAYGIVKGIPVDTWVIRLSNRIGLAGSLNPEEIEEELMKLVSRGDWRKITYVMKAHGKKICQSIVPVCSACMLNKICPRNGVTKSK